MAKCNSMIIPITLQVSSKYKPSKSTSIQFSNQSLSAWTIYIIHKEFGRYQNNQNRWQVTSQEPTAW